MNHPAWIGLHPAVTVEHLGYLPGFLDLADTRKAAAQFNERYVHGGWRPFGQDEFTLGANNTLRYPGDPPLKPIAMAMLRDEMILLYECSIVVIVQPDRSFEVARMD
jgi:hypothetical protein